MNDVPAYILAGGQSSRFGSDKARALVDGVPLIARIAAALRPVTRSVTVVSDVAGKYADLGLETIADAQPGLGPMGGLHTALTHLPGAADWLLLVSCDLVVLERAWIDALLAARTPEARAVAFMEVQGWQPLLALYHRAIAVEVDEHIARGQRSMRKLLDSVGGVGLPRPADWPEVLQVNTRDDLARHAHRRQA